jgi:hypothetical protein
MAGDGATWGMFFRCLTIKLTGGPRRRSRETSRVLARPVERRVAGANVCGINRIGRDALINSGGIEFELPHEIQRTVNISGCP